MKIRRNLVNDSEEVRPFFSICIPQYNRTSFLIEALRILDAQKFRDFEVCISDDMSNDGRGQELLEFLESSSLSYVYVRQESSLRYDANIRASIGLACGRYCFLHGNDDCLKSETTLEHLQRRIHRDNYPAVIIPNFEDWESGDVNRRIRHSGLYGSGPKVAVANYRNVAFVTGVMIETDKAQALEIAKWDGSEMYQMYLMARIVAAGGELLGLDESVVRKDIRIAGEEVDSYAQMPLLKPCPIEERKPPFVLIGRLITDAIDPYLSDNEKDRILRNLIGQLYLFTYPFWIFEYRRVQSWRYALGICMGIRPKNVYTGINVGLLSDLYLRILYSASCMIGLVTPITLFDRLKPALYKLAKSRR